MNPDFLDLLTAFNAADVRYMVVGAYAVAEHGRPRATKDLDLWIEANSENAARVMGALRGFGAPLGDLRVEDLASVGQGFMMGLPPRRIDLLTQISGLSFAEAWLRRIEREFGPAVTCPVIGLDDLLKNKRAAARPQDLADVDALERLHRVRNG